MNNVVDYFREVELPEKYYEACVTYNIINYFKEKRDECVFPFSISPVKERREGYDFGYSIKKDFFLLQYKKPYKICNGYRWDIDREQLKVIVNNRYASVVYYALPKFDNYKMWYHALSEDNMKFIDSITLQTYLERTNKRSINTRCEELKDWEQVIFELFSKTGYKSVLADKKQEFVEEIMDLVLMEGVIGYEIERR